MLGSELLERIRGKTGHARCQGCGEKIGLDARSGQLGLLGGRLVHQAKLQAPPTRVAPAGRPPTHAELRPPRVLATGSASPFGGANLLARMAPRRGELGQGRRATQSAQDFPARARAAVREWGLPVVAALLLTGFASEDVRSALSDPSAWFRGLESKLSAFFASRAAPAVPSQVPGPLPPAPTDVEPAAKPIRLPPDPFVSPEAALPPVPEFAGAAPAPVPSVGERRKAANDKDDARRSPSDGGTAKNDEPEPAPTPPPEPPFSKQAARKALKQAAAGARSCWKPGDSPGSAKVTVTFAPSGQVAAATVGGPLAGTATGSCIAARFRGATIPAFDGDSVTIGNSVTFE